MTMHVRGQIRERVRAMLEGVEGLAGHVTVDEPQTPDEAELPFAFIWLGSEDVAQVTLGSSTRKPVMERDCPLFVDIIGRSNAAAIDQIEEFVARVEETMGADPLLSGLVKFQQLRAVNVDRDETNAQSMTRLRMQFDIGYSTESGKPRAAL